uniref:CheW-like domain-containing protein n=1 Tax=candidate division WOR-3 bacterium TaxID=2052148 RepID=A0A7C4TCQ3_UNCW3
MALKFRKFYKPEEPQKEEVIQSVPINQTATTEELKEPVILKKEERTFAIFSVGSEWYGIDLDSIVEVLHNFEIVPVPHLPQSFMGVINLRGESVPVVLMSELLKQKTRMEGTKVCIISMVGNNKTGLLVDSEVEIVNYDKGKLYPLPDCFSKEEAEFLEGIFWYDNRFIGILRIENALSLLIKWRLEDE